METQAQVEGEGPWVPPGRGPASGELSPDTGTPTAGASASILGVTREVKFSPFYDV